MVAIGIVAAGLLVLVQQLSISFRESSANEDRAFAYQKAAALLSEIDNAIGQGMITDAAELLALDDSTHRMVLTTRRDQEGLPFAPDHPMSGNQQRQGNWVWSRRIRVGPHQDTDLLCVRIEVYRRTESGAWRLEASLAQVFSLLPETNAPQQTFDVYLLAIGTAPSSWGGLGELRTHLETAAAAIGSQSQASFRLHWITRSGYGRDPCYAPYVNTGRTADTAPPFCYWLPGALGGPQLGQKLYDNTLLGALHRTEHGLRDGMSAALPVPVTIADRNNHCMRSPAAWALFEQRVAAGLERPDEPPLQLLLDDLVQRPERYRNAIFVNLHGRALPCPPLRNYSDPAREPEQYPGIRVVTHPARLQTPRDPDGDGNHGDTEDLELRVYAYRTAGSGTVLTAPIRVRIYGGNFTTQINDGAGSTLLVHRLPGGVDPNTGAASGTNRTYHGFDSAAGVAPASPDATFAMYYQAGFVAGSDPYTWLDLYNTPLVAPQVGLQGLHEDGRLYGLDYVPSPVSGAFARDLAYESSSRAMRNTARWRIRLPKQILTGGTLPDVDQRIRVVTTIGTDPAAGRRWPVPVQPLNFSETFAWWTRSSAAVPPTERAQFLGDPRLCPYADLMAGYGPLANGYNWHFDRLQSGPIDARPEWPCFDAARLQTGFGEGERADAPRFLKLFREGLQAAGAVFVSPVGTLAEELYLGGEIIRCSGVDSMEPVVLHANWSGGTSCSIDTVTAGPTSGERVLTCGTTWWAKPWLGELFPDDSWATWYQKGNLPLGGSEPFAWHLRHQAYLGGLPYGTSFEAPAGARLGADGGTMLLATGTATSTFRMVRDPATAMPAPATNHINLAANIVPPTIARGAAMIHLAAKPVPAIPAFAFTDTYPRSTSSLLEPLWWAAGASGPTGAIVDCAELPQQRAYLVPWSLGSGGQPRSDQIAEQCLLGGLQAFHTAADPVLPGRIVQLPRIEILAPSTSTALASAAAIELRWRTEWMRFDGRPYREGISPSFAESEQNLVYRVLMSADDGVTWFSALTGQLAWPGQWPQSTAERLVDTGTGHELYTITLAEPLAEGRYTILVEAWRSDNRCHSAAHRVLVHVRE